MFVMDCINLYGNYIHGVQEMGHLTRHRRRRANYVSESNLVAQEMRVIELGGYKRL